MLIEYEEVQKFVSSLFQDYFPKKKKKVSWKSVLFNNLFV